MTNQNTQSLEQAICDYLQWMKSREYKHSTTRRRYEKILSDFLVFVRHREIAWNDIFTMGTLKAFQKDSSLTNVSDAIRGLSWYLFKHSRIPQPLRKPNCQIDLPVIYEEYLTYHEKSRQVPYRKIKHIRRVLAAFHDCLERAKITLSCISIEQVDTFLAEFTARFAPATCRLYRSYLRGFLSYLYHERRIGNRDLAPLVVGAPVFAQAKPPNFIRPQEVRRLFAGLRFCSPRDLRTYAMIHLAYTLGLRPSEISLISMDDISFTKAELRLKNRKSNNPVILPLPEDTVKAIAAYMVGGRPKSKLRTLFLSLKTPCGPITPGVVGYYISECMRKAGLPSSAYWLRHTYAQTLLEAGVSLYEIKEMLGHDSIESTRKYLHIHTRLMREALFDETL
jgi:integrase/recombinase XerD